MNVTHMLSTYRQMGRNFMTPDVISYQQTEKGIKELSRGTGIDGSKIWGVSDFEYVESRLQPTGKGQMFTTYREARGYYNSLN